MKKNRNDTLTWAFGKRSRYVHAYCGPEAVTSGVALCGNTCTPQLVLHDWNPDVPEMQKITCPRCLERLPYTRFILPQKEVSGK